MNNFYKVSFIRVSIEQYKYKQIFFVIFHLGLSKKKKILFFDSFSNLIWYFFNLEILSTRIFAFLNFCFFIDFPFHTEYLKTSHYAQNETRSKILLCHFYSIFLPRNP